MPNAHERYQFAPGSEYIATTEYCTSSLEECIDCKMYELANNKPLSCRSYNEHLFYRHMNELTQSPNDEMHLKVH